MQASHFALECRRSRLAGRQGTFCRAKRCPQRFVLLMSALRRGLGGVFDFRQLGLQLGRILTRAVDFLVPVVFVEAVL